MIFSKVYKNLSLFNRHYSILRRLLKSGIKNDSEDKQLTKKILALKWKRVFPASKQVEEGGRTKKVHFQHSTFHEQLGISADSSK